MTIGAAEVITIMTPRVFVGSSTEGLNIAYALQVNLEQDAEVTVWTQDVFRPSEYILEGLLKELDATDCGIFVFSPDDTVLIRGAEHTSVRDNVIFEVGLYIGRLGRDRSFIVAPRGGNPRLPSDLLGVTVLNFEGNRQDGRLEAALGPASARIRAALQLIVPRRAQKMPSELGVPIMERRGLLSDKQRALLGPLEAVPRISYEELAELFPDMTTAELHYRLEQLRLLQFIIAIQSPNPDRPSEFFSLHPLYAQARRTKPVMMSRAATKG
jgi:hypothetical protein